MTWYVDPVNVFGQMFDNYAAYITYAISAVMRMRAPQIEAWMKSEAGWIDRTGNARQSLYAEFETLGQGLIGIAIDYGVDYGRFLEFAHAGRFAIIAPALDHWMPIIMEDVQRMLNKR